MIIKYNDRWYIYVKFHEHKSNSLTDNICLTLNDIYEHEHDGKKLWLAQHYLQRINNTVLEDYTNDLNFLDKLLAWFYNFNFSNTVYIDSINSNDMDNIFVEMDYYKFVSYDDWLNKYKELLYELNILHIKRKLLRR